MSNKTYQQACPLALTLDIIGERWTLLVIRELLVGVRRFKDLQNGLPGVSTNTLTQRLRDLEDAGLIRRNTLPPPSGVDVYELTDMGHALERSILALIEWGIRYLPLPPDDAAFLMSSVVLALKSFFNSEIATEIEIHANFKVDHEVMKLDINAGALSISTGRHKRAEIEVDLSARTFMQLLLQRLSIEHALKTGLLELQHGDVKRIHELFACFPLAVEGQQEA